MLQDATVRTEAASYRMGSDSPIPGMNPTTLGYLSTLKLPHLQSVARELGIRGVQGPKAQLVYKIQQVLNDSSSATRQAYQLNKAEQAIHAAYMAMLAAGGRAPRAIAPSPLSSQFSPHLNAALHRAVQPSHATPTTPHNSTHPPPPFSTASTPAASNSAWTSHNLLSPPQNVGGPTPPTPPASAPRPTTPRYINPLVAGNTAIRCVCGTQRVTQRSDMVQCGECGQWQHGPCLGHPPGVSPHASHLCDRCRVDLSDPYWATELWVMGAAMEPAAAPSAGVLDFKRCTLGFRLAEGERRLLLAARGDPTRQLQLVCVALEDTERVPCRLHWPTNAVLQINSMSQTCRKMNASRKFGANARDEPVDITQFVYPTACNAATITSHSDKGSFRIMLRFARRRTDEEVAAMMAPAEDLQAAMRRVSHAAQGPNDKDDDVVFDTFKISLRCPLSGSRVRLPARFADVGAFCVFDLQDFLDGAKRTRKWQCPSSLKNSHIRLLQRDVYIERVLAHLAHHPGVMEIDVDSHGRWRSDAGSPWQSVLDPVPPPPLPSLSRHTDDSDDSDSRSQDSFERMLEGRRRRDGGASGRVEAESAPGGAGSSRAKRSAHEAGCVDLCDSDDDADARGRGSAAGASARHVDAAALRSFEQVLEELEQDQQPDAPIPFLTRCQALAFNAQKRHKPDG